MIRFGDVTGFDDSEIIEIDLIFEHKKYVL
jgi:hypothetical protein